MNKTAEVACRFWICMLAAVMTFVSLIPASKSLSNEKPTRYRAGDGVFRQSLAYIPIDQSGDLDVSLNGEWRFMLNGPEKDFFKPDFDVSGWAAIKVPGNWEVQGFEEPLYKEPAEGVGLYRRTFQINLRETAFFIRSACYVVRIACWG